MLSLVTSCLYISAAATALVGGWMSNKYGRKVVMISSGAFFGAGTVLVAAAVDLTMLIIGRVVLGFAVGLAASTTPLFISEMAPAHARGALNLAFQVGLRNQLSCRPSCALLTFALSPCFQMAVTIGIFAAQLINYGTLNIAEYGWRISLALGGVPALSMFIGSILLPDTPNSLIARGKPEEGRAVLQRIRGDQANVQVRQIKQARLVAHARVYDLLLLTPSPPVRPTTRSSTRTSPRRSRPCATRPTPT